MMQAALNKPVLLMVDDDEDDVYSIRRAFCEHRSDLVFNSVQSGVEMFDYLNSRANYKDPRSCPVPDFILLDINLPADNGIELLKQLRANDKFAHLPVSMLSTSSTSEDIRQAYQSGANSYICKSVGIQEMREVADLFCQYWFSVAKLPMAV